MNLAKIRQLFFQALEGVKKPQVHAPWGFGWQAETSLTTLKGVSISLLF